MAMTMVLAEPWRPGKHPVRFPEGHRLRAPGPMAAGGVSGARFTPA